MPYTKQRVHRHMMADRSIRIVHDLLPDEWVIREYRPDYGLDLAIELFESLDEERTRAATLGETLFVQVKSTEAVRTERLKVYARHNVELGPLRENRSKAAEVDVVRLRLETSELLTVQAIGAAVPVLLFLVELSTRRIYFVCLNDLVEKVILPHDPDYAAKASKVLHIPSRNCIAAGDPLSLRPLETYAKRAKLYAAFEKFAYQRHELDVALGFYAGGDEDRRGDAARTVLNLVRHFLSIVLRYDFWTRMPEWRPIGWSHRELTVLHQLLLDPEVENSRPAMQSYLLDDGSMQRNPEWVRSLDLLDTRAHVLLHVASIWQRLENLGRMYEEIGREWFLPTLLSSHLVDL